MTTPRKTFTTAKGTELPLLNLKNKEYLQVAHRLVWFRETYPTGIIKTTMLALQGAGNDEYAVFKSEIYVDTERGPLCIASGHKKETRGGFDDFIEKAETGSIGRALALAGFGTQFTGDELNEGNRLADAPVEVISRSTNSGTGITAVGNNTNTSGAGVAVTNGGGPVGIVANTRKPSFRKNVSAVVTGEDI